MDPEIYPSVSQAGNGETAEVVRRIVELIRERPLKPGDKLPPIRELADMLEVKPTMVRDALLHEDHNLFHLLDARRTLEIELVGRAAKRRHLEELLPVRDALQALNYASDTNDYVENDIRFHSEIARLAGNPVLFSVHQSRSLQKTVSSSPKRKFVRYSRSTTTNVIL